MSWQTKFLLLVGPSGVGKSTIIRKLFERDSRFVYPSPYYTTRSLREGEKDKIAISDGDMDVLETRSEVLVHTHYGARYAIPLDQIKAVLSRRQFPILDWTAKGVYAIRKIFADNLFVVYIAPPSLKVLQARLQKDGRDSEGMRYRVAEDELTRYWSEVYDPCCDIEIVSHEHAADGAVYQIYTAYLSSMR